MRDFLYALMREGNVSEAARQVGANRTALYQKRARDDEFAALWDECLAIGCDNLEDTARRLAVNGWDEPIFHDGEVVGSKRKYSPALIIFLLKSHKPEKYRERFDIEQSAKGGGPLALQVILDPKAVAESDAAS